MFQISQYCLNIPYPECLKLEAFWIWDFGILALYWLGIPNPQIQNLKAPMSISFTGPVSTQKVSDFGFGVFRFGMLYLCNPETKNSKCSSIEREYRVSALMNLDLIF